MDLQHLPVNWFDLTVVAFLLFGLVRGRKNGLSQELLIMLQWVAIVCACGYGYKTVGEFMSQNTVFSLLFSYIVSYLSIAIGVSIFFSLVKRLLGGKLVGSDVFGSGEYYIGMPAGMVRFACIAIFLLSFVGARFYSQAEIKAQAKYNTEIYGNTYWPTLPLVQDEIFRKSFTGPYIRQFLGFLLITPTPPDNKPVKTRVNTEGL